MLRGLGVAFALLTPGLLAGCGSSGPSTPAQVAAPLISPATGSYPAPLASTLSSTTNGALICYSTTQDPAIANGACAAGSSPYTGPIAIATTGVTVRAVAGLQGLMTSPISTASYTLLLPQITPNSTSLAFGGQPAGTVSPAQSVRLSNTGQATLSLSSLGITGVNGSAFSETNSCGQSLPIGSSCVVMVSFAPQASGPFTAALQISGNTNGPPTTIGLSGTGLVPAATLSAGTLTFPSTVVGDHSAAQTIQLTNSGGAVLLLCSIGIAGAGAAAFSETNTCGASLAVGASCTISALFSPAAGGTVTATLQIASNVTGTPATVALSGTGLVPEVTLSATSLTFANTDAGFQAPVQTVQLTNTGGAPLLLSSIGATGAEAVAFAETNTCGVSLAAGASCTIRVTFAPEAASSYVAMLLIADNASASPQTITLSGTGTPDTPLSAWQNALRNCQTEVVNVVVLADSRSIVDTTIIAGASATLADTFGQKWADRLRTTLQATCGSHGSGLVPLLPLAGFSDLNGDYYQATGTWTAAYGFGPYQTGGVPAGLVLEATSTMSLLFGNTGDFDHLNVYCSSGPGLNAWTMTVEGQTVGTCGGSSSNLQAVVAVSSGVPFGPHVAGMTCAQSPCVAYGMETTAGTTGLSLHNLAVGSCTAECFGLNPATQLAFSDLIGGGQHLVILGVLTNEAGAGYSPESFSVSLSNIIDHERGLPAAPSVLIYAPLQDIIMTAGPYYPVLPAIAGTYSTAYFDMRDTYGPSFQAQYFGPDMTHENNAGHAVVYEQMIRTLLP